MADKPSQPNKYVRVIDISARAVAAERARSAKEALEQSDGGLPPLTLDQMPQSVQAATERAGWPGLTPVQEGAIPYLLERRDLIVQSRTGSGKTGAFLLPLWELLDPSLPEVQALILTPTRELARQVLEEFDRVQPREGGQLRAALVYGGVKYAPQISALKDGAQLVVGTPGRVIDLLEQRHMSLANLRIFVLDEADEMLSMGFYPAMQVMQRYLPPVRNSYMFSATIPIRVQNLAEEFLSDPGFLGLSAGDESVATSQHRYYIVDPMAKNRSLIALIEMENPESAIIFANTKRDVEYLSAFLQNYGHDADGISGDLTQSAREAVMQRVKEASLRFLVATDVAARGIDVSDLSHVFMYDVPENHEYYIHRSGRTARAGRTGTVIVLATLLEHSGLQSIAKRYGIELEKREIPTEEEVGECISERMTVLLEDAFRGRTRMEKERMKRFIPMTRQLAEEEPELLAMLVDRLYHEQLHRPDDRPDNDPPPKRAEPQRKPQRNKGRRDSRN
jgi:ATP-dependent RNA helicase DeaD